MGSVIDFPVQGYASLFQLSEDNAALGANRAAMERSAAMERANAVAALQEGARDVALLRGRGSQTEGAQRVAVAGSGVDASSATTSNVMASTDIWTELDAQTARNNARSAARGREAVAYNYTKEAQQIQREMLSNVDRTVVGNFKNWTKATTSIIGMK